MSPPARPKKSAATSRATPRSSDRSAAEIQDTGLDERQLQNVVTSHVLQFSEFREITLFDAERGVIVTSRIGPPRVSVPKDPGAIFDGVSMSPIRVDEDLLPTAVFSIQLTRLNQPAGWLVGEFSLEEMWRMVDQIRIGQRGYALVVAPDGTLIAHGDPDKKALVAQSRNMRGGHPLVDADTDGADHR